MSTWPPRVDYNLAVLRICKQLQIEDFSREQIAQNSTGFTFCVEACYQGKKLQAFGTNLNEKMARMEASKNGLIQIVQRARMIGDPALSIEKCGLTEEDLSNLTGEKTDNLSEKAVDKSNSLNETKSEAVVEDKTMSNPSQSISNSPASLITPQPVEFDYHAAFNRLKQTGSTFTFKKLTVQDIADTKFTFLLEFCHNGHKLQALGSDTTKKKAKKNACKNGLMEMWLCNQALSLDECGLTKQDVADYNTHLLDLQVKLRDTTNGPVSSTVSSTEEDLSNLTGKQAENLSAKAVDKSNSLNQTKSEAVLETKTMSNLSQSGSDSTPSSTTLQPVDQKADLFVRPQSDPQKTVSKEPSTNENDAQQVTNDEQQVEKTTGQHEESHLTQIQKQLDKIENTYLKEMASELKKLINEPQGQSASRDLGIAQEAVGYLQEHQSLFQELLVLQEENSMSYTELIRWIINSMPERKLKYEFNLSDRVGIGQLFYKGLRIQIVFKSYQAISCPDLTSLEEACSRKMFFFLKMNYSN